MDTTAFHAGNGLVVRSTSTDLKAAACHRHNDSPSSLGPVHSRRKSGGDGKKPVARGAAPASSSARGEGGGHIDRLREEGTLLVASYLFCTLLCSCIVLVVDLEARVGVAY
jgi:hypothetical protein